MPVVGYITDGLRVSNSSAIDAFRDGLNETGFVQGQNLIIEWRKAMRIASEITQPNSRTCSCCHLGVRQCRRSSG